ncbi:conjugal transfer protein TraC [Candidatus Uhrbacteria bacterium RIFCSPLOWO2_12_FULL_46_10]|uniref:Conjugal transfer protein TraC n=1 Tax=Candidatus Uhrbacteria bacterium RIFCSPLOWO2_01_FULL_47_25 TaxID=1802402 RepID=A0A1F7UZQ6_9BACT|nr:MAG: conjugal transfer protein TraC [Candidatus Uhrbacteria bacterium RIFCSPHIGHO2_01_FULL_46_23]OGL68611.1 MAG: conjugal transfer protein TraC [Candidatus Uhrbacteria bacterium RIFCSPHIGHO2_02_FULL_47_29]OGL75775.1 MAG: conjugal transfer protein TraC [Candidatus Uhrbacteria bacterium RIFCSPHIGHO2_12_FULL_46_13]OGL83214.1 MAG: conjugal transfer protein TraC [Candidatus Uhrbacteria bacterium RIFCSPLOWO2_01_FULL_47_25]OGL86136.1 MAG: conjugal transfer protein TraC [Candidatus Uhrbacteria bacte
MVAAETPKTAVAPVTTAEERQTIEEAKIYRRGVVSLRDIVAPTALEVESSLIRLNDRYVRTIFVTDYPRYISVGWFAPIINFNAALDISLYTYPVRAEIILKQLRNKVGALEAQIIAEHDKGAPRDPIKETALKDIERLRDDLTQGIEKFFQFALYISVYANTKEELDRLTDDIIALLGTKLVYARKVLYQAEQGFTSTVPLGNDELQITFNMNTSPISSAFPFVSSELTSDNGILYGINRHNNSLILFDRFSLMNANTVVFATAGAGKSYAIKLEVLRSLMMGVDIIIIDPEKEYRHLCEAVGGTYLNISLSSDTKVNPFDLPKSTGQDVQTGDIIRSAVITLKGLLRIMLGQFTHEEDSLMDRALLETYAKKDITPDADLSKAEPPVMQDLEEVLKGIEGTKDLVARLQKYTNGTFAGLLNNPTNVTMDNQLMVFSVRDLEDELRPIAIYTIINYIWNIVRSEVKKRILVIDEAWWLMQHEDSAKFIFALVKRCRKYYLGITTITQDVNDFLTSPYGQAVVNNSSMQLLLKQSPAAIDLVQKTFLLTEGEKYLLLEGGVGEGIFFAGPKHAAIKVVASYTEDQLITTDPRQLLEIEAAKKEFAAAEAKAKDLPLAG